ncbi:GldG family protein [Melioribacteraceae bacterium 4301-Me]|uniref:GldG family protein n=1 Tax=Pyranulibacter aquaticus TaxID=3163344 RepID=UPI00359A28A1
MLTKKKVRITLLLIFGVLILLNIIASKFFVRLDFTEDKRYSLSDATKNILKNLHDPITVTAYFSENLPPNIAQVRQDFRDLLVEYANKSGNMIVYEFVNPNETQESEIKAQQAGIRPIMINVRERDQIKQQRAYLGTVVQMGDKQEVIPFIQPGAAMEYDLSTTIKKLTVKNKPWIGFLTGNGEPSINEMPQLKEQLDILYNIDSVKIKADSTIPEKFKTLVIISPKDSLTEGQFTVLDNFLARGGNILVAYSAVDANMSTAMGNQVKSNFGDWLKKKGIEVDKNFLIDANCSTVMVKQQQGMFIFQTPVKFPYLPVINSFAKNPITEGLESVMLIFASPLKFNSLDTSIKITPIAFSSKKSGTEKPPVYFNAARSWSSADFTMGSLPVAAIAEGKLAGNKNSKLVVIGSGQFIINGSGQNAQQLEPDNVNFVSNAIDWLSDDTGLVQLRTKGVTARPIDPSLEDSTKTLLKYLNFLIPIFLVIGYGIFRYQMNLKKKNKLISENYV